MMVNSNAVEEFNAMDLHSGVGNNQLRIGPAKIALDESTGNPQPKGEGNTSSCNPSTQGRFPTCIPCQRPLQPG
ncbi:MAG: hypothetical protein SVZ03_08140 [Spirochaetota bacterium]|nr:hypothetical protein [Spirochaetota bacterium]